MSFSAFCRSLLQGHLSLGLAARCTPKQAASSLGATACPIEGVHETPLERLEMDVGFLKPTGKLICFHRKQQKDQCALGKQGFFHTL